MAKRANSTGYVYKRGQTWTVQKTIGYEAVDGKLMRRTVSKGGFRTKREAMEYFSQLAEKKQSADMTLRQVYDRWEPTHQAGKSTMDGYRAAFNWFADLHHIRFADIDIDDLQDCIDDCPRAKRTKQDMKTLIGLLYKYAIPRHLATLNLCDYITVRADDSTEREALPMEAVKKLQEAIGKVPYADYIVCQCYLGFRPAELLDLTTFSYNRKDKTLTGGAKTEAGKNRIVPISPKIQPIIDRLTSEHFGYIFGDADGKQLSIERYRAGFYAALDAIGFENPMVKAGTGERRKYSPHSCRHTFATLIKAIDAPDKDKLRLIGHTSTEMLMHYQDVAVEDLRKIVNAM